MAPVIKPDILKASGIAKIPDPSDVFTRLAKDLRFL